MSWKRDFPDIGFWVSDNFFRMTFGEQVLQFHQSLRPDWELPPGFELLFPYGEKATWDAMSDFYKKYYGDSRQRTFLLGINPGRFGAGITGIPFTDPVRLEEDCGIPNAFRKRQELSSVFVYQVVEAFGEAGAFYQKFYVTAICPLGFVKDGKNINYYDDKRLQQAVEPHIIQSIETQIRFGCNRKTAVCLGKGKNFKYFLALNKRLQLFEEIVPLPHPRWVMQYRRRRMEEFVGEYLKILLDAGI